MKRKIAGMKAVFCICAAIGWWGFLYPELTLTSDTYEIVWEENVPDSEEDMMEGCSQENVYRELLEADEGRIHYKSRFLMQLESLFERLK